MKRLLSFLRRSIIYWLPLALLLTTALAHLVLPEEFDQLSSLIAFDVHQRIAPREPPADTPVLIVDIDEPSLKQIAASEVPNIQAEIDGIRALGTPSGDAAKVATMIATAQTDLNKVKGDPSLLTRKTSAFVGFANVAHPYGLTACAPTA